MKRLLALSLLLVAMQPALAINNKKPNACPTVNALTSVGVNFAKQREPGIWDAYQLKHTYSTDSEWTFEMTAFISDSANAALAKANAAISKLDYYMGDQPTH